MSSSLSLSAAIVTFDRLDEVGRAVRSCLRPEIERIVVLDNGSATPVGDLVGAVVDRSEVNLGPCAARNLVVDACGTDLVLLVDDDAFLAGSSDLGRVVTLFEADPGLAVVAGVEYRGDGSIARHEYPRRRVRDVGIEGPVGYFIEGACVVRRAAFLAVGGFDPEFFYGHEGTDLSLRFARHGWSIRYSPALRLEHRPSASGRSSSTGTEARQLVNRTVLARRSLPAPARWIHVAVWSAHGGIAAARRGPRALAAYVSEVRRLRRERLVATTFPPAERLRLRDVPSLHRRGYRILW